MDAGENTHVDDDTQPRDSMTCPDSPGGSFSRECLGKRILGSVFGDPSELYLGHYRLLEKLGEGGMGVVYAATDKRLGRRVAIKLLRRRTDQLARRRLIREAKALARVSHPNVVQVHDLGEHEGQIFIVMEYIDGVDLRTWLRKSKRSPSEILKVFLAAGHGLMAAHAHGIVHRDFKPANIMLGSDGRVRVVDFGLARNATEPESGDGYRGPAPDSIPRWENLRTDDLTDTGAVIGTPAYMAPEQLRGAEAGPKADQFSFCVALWEALHGSRPFRATSVAAMLTEMLEARLEENESGVSDGIRRALVRGLSHDPNRRWPSIEALLAALSPARRRARRRGAALAIAAVSISASLGIAILSLLGSGTPRHSPGNLPLSGVDFQDIVHSTGVDRTGSSPARAASGDEQPASQDLGPVESQTPEFSPASASIIKVAPGAHRSPGRSPTVKSERMILVERCRSLLSCLRPHAVPRNAPNDTEAQTP